MAELHVVIAGASGFLGSRLRSELLARGHRVTALVRRVVEGPEESHWDPDAGMLDAEVIEAADVVVNLAGTSTFGNPWSKKWARALRESRVRTTGLLARTIADTGGRAAFVAGNAVGWYGDHGDALLTEAADSRGHALLTNVCREWQSATTPAAEAGARVVVLRTAPVMDSAAPPLRQLRHVFGLGLGARIGSGRQFMPMISVRDWVGAAAYLIEHPTAAGPVNLCCRQTPTNAEFTTALARALHRPAFAFVPRPAVKAAGPLAPELLGSLNLRPQALLDLGYEFSDPDVTTVLASGLP